MSLCAVCNSPESGSFCSKCGNPLAGGATGPRQVTVLFADLQGSSALAQEHSLEESARVIQRYHQIMDAAINRYAGYIAQVGGDDFLACFGYPDSIADGPIRAVEAARWALRQLKVEQINGSFPLAVRMAIHQGMTLFFVAPNGDVQFSGETPIVAARMQRFASPNAVLVSKIVADRIANRYQMHRVGPLPLKGLNESMLAYELGARIRANDSWQVGIQPQQNLAELTPLVGRDELLNDLSDWLVEPGPARLVLGEPGVGKSRLAYELCRRHSGNSLPVLCKSNPHQRSFELVFDLIDAVLNTQTATNRLTRLQQLAPISAGLPHLMALFGGTPADGVTTAPELAALTLELVQAKAITLLVVEDFHFIDPASLEVLALVNQSPALKLLLNARPEFTHSIAWADQTELETLTKDQAGAFLQSALGSDRSTRLLDDFFLRTNGNPLYLEQLLYALLDGTLATTPSSIRPEELDLTKLPSSLTDLLISRIDGLGELAPVLRTASVLGHKMPISHLQSLTGLDGAPLQQAVEKLHQLGLFRRLSEFDVEFCHGLVHEVAYATLQLDEKRQLHQRAADLLDRNSAPAHQVAQHWEQGGEMALAISAYERAGELELEQGLHGNALKFAEYGLSLLEQRPRSQWRDQTQYQLLVLQGNAACVLEGYGSPKRLEISEQTLALAEQLPDAGGELVPLLYARWTYYLARSDFNTRDWAQRLDGFTQQQVLNLPRQLEVTRGFVQATTHFMAGELTPAIAYFEGGLAEYQESEHKYLMRLYGEDHGLYSSCWLQWAYVHAGQVNEALLQCEKSSKIAERIDDPFALLLTLIFTMHVSNELDDLDKTIAIANKITEVSTQYGLDYYESIAAGSRARALVLKGEHQHLDQAKEAWLALEANEHTNMSIIVHRDLARYHLQNGNLAEADVHISAAEKIVTTTFETLYQPEVLRLRGWWHELQLEFPQAEAAYRQSLKYAEQQGANYFLVKTGMRLAELLIKLDRQPEAIASTALWRPLCQRGNCTLYDEARSFTDAMV